jgi:hypothetical protein
MCSNLPASKVKNMLTMYINLIRRSMGLSNHQEYGMNALGTFSLKMVLRLVKQIQLSLLKRWVKIYLYAKYTLMILSFVLLINLL